MELHTTETKIKLFSHLFPPQDRFPFYLKCVTISSNEKQKCFLLSSLGESIYITFIITTKEQIQKHLQYQFSSLSKTKIVLNFEMGLLFIHNTKFGCGPTKLSITEQDATRKFTLLSKVSEQRRKVVGTGAGFYFLYSLKIN